MIIPKFSIRHLFWLIAIVAIYSALVASAARGSNVSWALAVGIAGLVIPFMFHIVVYQLAVIIAQILLSRTKAHNSDTEAVPCADDAVLSANKS